MILTVLDFGFRIYRSVSLGENSKESDLHECWKICSYGQVLCFLDFFLVAVLSTTQEFLQLLSIFHIYFPLSGGFKGLPWLELEVL